MLVRPSEVIVPQLAIGGVNPNPRKLKKASVKMAEGISQCHRY